MNATAHLPNKHFIGRMASPSAIGVQHTRSELQLSAAPNPAKESVNISYRYAAAASEADKAVRVLEVYDMTGRLMASHQPRLAQGGTWNLPLATLAPGIYQVVMKEHGRKLATLRLSVTH